MGSIMQQIRLTKTPEIERVLSFLRAKYHLLSESEIIKVALSEKYNSETGENKDAKAAWDALKIEGKKLGDKLLRAKGLKREAISEEEFYNAILKDA